MQNVESSATTKSKGILVLSWLTGQVETLVQTKLAGLYFPLEKNVVFRPSLLLYAQRNCHKMTNNYMYLSQTYLTIEKTTLLISTDQMKKQIVILG